MIYLSDSEEKCYPIEALTGEIIDAFSTNYYFIVLIKVLFLMA